MMTHDLIQGSDAWDQFRLTHFGASEAAAMLGVSRKTTRNELLRMKKTGIAKEFSDWVQKNVLDHGHAVEGPARKIIEAEIGETLYPVTCSDGEISASCDGLTMAEDLAWENKQWNEEYAAAVLAGQVPEEHMPQCQQVLMVTKADRLIFSISDGTRERTVWVVVHPNAEWFARIRAGWQQFAADLATYTPTEVVAEMVGRAPEALPALHIVLKGEVSASNLAEFKDVALTAIRSVNRELKTDQDFADSAKARKWCEDIEARVSAAKDHALSQTASIDLLFRTMDEVSAEARDVRLALEKLEKARKESRKGEIVAGGVKGLSDHIAALNVRLGKPYMPAPSADFGTAVKGLKTFDSMQNAVDTALANAKMAASAIADRIDANLKHLAAEAADHSALFPDEASVVLKAADDFAALVQFRVADFKAKEEKRKADDLAKAAVVVEPVAAPVAAPAPAVISMPMRTAAARATAPSTPPSLGIGTINERLQHFTVTEVGLRGLGFEPAGRERAAPRYHEADFPHMLAAIVGHMQAIQARQAA
jgi:predicted phage-related endonuclease